MENEGKEEGDRLEWKHTQRERGHDRRKGRRGRERERERRGNS